MGIDADVTAISDEFRVTKEVFVSVGRLVIEPMSGKQNGWQSNVLIDGVKQDGVRSLTLRMEVDCLPVLTIERNIHR